MNEFLRQVLWKIPGKVSIIRVCGYLQFYVSALDPRKVLRNITILFKC